jgi:hypothetical protein
MEQILAGLGNRIFLMNNVHEDEPVVFETRWCLSYLRGPLTRTQIKTLMDEARGKGQGASGPTTTSVPSSPVPHASGRSPGEDRPVLPPDVPQHFLPVRGFKPEGSELVYAPMLVGSSEICFTDSKLHLETTQEVTRLIPISAGAVAVKWDEAAPVELAVADLEQAPEAEARFLPVPAGAGTPKSYETWNKEFGAWLYRTQKLQLFRSPSTGHVSHPGETEQDFRLRLQQSGRETRDQGADSLRRKYAPKIAALQERLRRAEHLKEKQQADVRSSQMQAAISVGASILGAFLGRKAISATNIGRATTAIRGAGRVLKESQDVTLAQENVAAVQQQLADLEAQFKAESEALAAASDPLQEKFEPVWLRPAKANITVKLVALAWTPHWRASNGSMTPAWA